MLWIISTAIVLKVFICFFYDFFSSAIKQSAPMMASPSKSLAGQKQTERIHILADTVCPKPHSHFSCT